MGSTPPPTPAEAQRAASRLRRRYLTARRSKYLSGEVLGECLAIGLDPHNRTASEARWFRGVHSRNKGLFYRGARGTGPNDGSGLGALGNGVYLTWSKPMAEFFAQRSGGQVYTYKVPSNLKLLDAQSEEMADIKATFGFAPHEYSNDPGYSRAITREVKALGYDGVISDNQADGLVVFNPREVKIVEDEDTGV